MVPHTCSSSPARMHTACQRLTSAASCQSRHKQGRTTSLQYHDTILTKVGDSWMPAVASTMLDRLSPMKSEDTTSSWVTLAQRTAGVRETGVPFHRLVAKKV